MLLEDIKHAAERLTGLACPSAREAQALVRERKANAYRFGDDGLTPNHPRWPLIQYRGVVKLDTRFDPAAIFEVLFEAHGWRGGWRDGIYDYLHYHSDAHEVLGIARGHARVRFGGARGRNLELKAGDVIVQPAGTGHQRISASRDLLVVGAYPNGKDYDMCRSNKGDHDRALRAIAKTRSPRTDPVYGGAGPLESFVALMFIGTAGWNVPTQYAASFPKSGTHLQRYGARLNAVEINSSFYRPHQRKTYVRWADSVPDNFRFSVKLPRSITHERRLKDCDELLARFLDEVGGLGNKLGVLLAQLPPSLIYDAGTVSGFFRDLRRGKAMLACEPRHASWFTPQADAALARLKVARVAADPPRAASDGAPGGWQEFAYWRMHGSPKIYYSDYDAKALKALASRLRPHDWCIFDNTAAFAALGNALSLNKLTDA